MLRFSLRLNSALPESPDTAPPPYLNTSIPEPLNTSMTTQDRNTATKGGDLYSFPVAATEVIPLGTLVGGNASGYAEDASAASLVILGLAQERVDNGAGANGDADVTVRRCRVFLANSSTAPVTQAHVGQVAHAEDNETVAAPGSAGPAAGVIESVDTNGVWINLDRVAAVGPGLSIAVANSAVPDGNAAITIQSTERARQIVHVWFAATAYAAPADLGTLTATTGELLKEHTDDAFAAVLTDATGLAVLALDTTSDGDVHAHAEVGGRVVTASEAITGN